MNVDRDLPPASKLLPGSYPTAIQPMASENVETESTVTVRPLPKIANTSSMLPPAATHLSQIGSVPEPSQLDNAALQGEGSVYHEVDAAELDDRILIQPSGPLEGPARSANADLTATVDNVLTRRETKPNAGGVHRFTFVNQKAIKKVEAIKGKKQSACTFND